MRCLAGIFLMLPLSWVCSGATATPTSPVKLLNGPVIEIDPATASGKGVLTLNNGSQRPVTVLLNAKASSTPKPPQGQFVFSSVTQPEQTDKNARAGKKEADKPPATQVEGRAVEVKARASVKVEVAISGQVEAGEFEATLVDDSTGAELGKLKFRRLPFSVKLAGADPEKLEVALVEGQRAEIQLRNDDARPYKLDWELHVDDKPVCGDTVSIAPGGLAMIVCTPGSPIVKSSGTKSTDCWLWRFGRNFPWHPRNLLKLDTPRDGGKHNLYAAKETNRAGPAPAGENPVQPVLLKAFPVKASLNYHPATIRDPVKFLVLVLVLTLGGIVSLFLNFFLPNRLRELNVIESLNTLARSTADLSTRVDSRLGVMLRLERSRLGDLLKSRRTYSPDFADLASQVEAGIAQLRSRVQLAQQMDLVRDRLEKNTSEATPPSKVDQINGLLLDALVPLAKSEASSADLQEAQAAITKADAIVQTLDQPNDDFGREVAKRIKDLLAITLPDATRAAFDDLCKEVPGPLASLSGFNGDIAPPASCATLDMAVEKVYLMQQFARLVSGTADKEMLGRLQSHRKPMTQALQTGWWQDLERARLLIREMKDDIYPERITEKLKENGLYIQVNPPVAYDSAPLELSVVFRDPRLNGCAAREEWTCDWDFGDKLTGRGWDVSHYFLLEKNAIRKAQAQGFKVKVWLRGPDGMPAGMVAYQETPHASQVSLGSSGQPTDELTVRPPRARTSKDRASLELIKLGAALAIAVFGLVAGAQQQLDQLDVIPGLVAIFLVGFGADTIKNLLTQTSTKPKTPTPPAASA